jgi:endo-alpha-1,4-polygalactosaminidase (GH114 family)
MSRLGRTSLSLLLGAAILVPASAFAQSGNEARRGNWQGAYSKQASQRAEDLPAIDAAGVAVAQNQPPEQSQAQAPAAPAAPGRVRAQGRDVTPSPAAPALPPIGGAAIDLREQMRKFIQTISTFARRQNRNFAVIAQGGLDLLVKRDPIDDTKVSPARAYMHSIDGVMVEGLFYEARRVFGEPPPAARQARFLRLAETAKENGLRVFVVDFTADPRNIEDSYRRNQQRGYISYAAPSPLPRLNALARLPARPVGENPKSIISLSDAKNFAYITDSAAFGRQDEFALAMHQVNYDLLVTSVFHGRDPLTARAVETLKYKLVGGKRLVFATIDIGSAASYRYYWKPNWREGSPAFVGAPFADDPDRFHAEFWRPEWQRLIAGDNQSYVFGIIAQGFDGVVLTGMEEAYRFFEGGEEQEEEQQPQIAAPPGATTPLQPTQPTGATAPASPAGAATTAPPVPVAPRPGAPVPLTPPGQQQRQP